MLPLGERCLVRCSVQADCSGIKAWLAADRADKSARRAEERASEAAKEARAALRKGDAAEDIRAMSDMAIALIGYVEDDKREAAQIKARDLAVRTTHVVNRRDRFFSDEAKAKLVGLNTQVMTVSRTLAAGGIPGDVGRKEELLDSCYEIMSTLTGESGRILGDIERTEE
jgi:hypothetical protein